MMADRSSPTPNHPTRATEAFYGRRKGKHLRAHQKAALSEVLPKLKLDLDRDAPKDLSDLWLKEEVALRSDHSNQSDRKPCSTIRLEIGFGGGEHLLHRAKETPDIAFIGIEPFVNSMAKLVHALETEPLSNIRLFDDDATQVLDWLPDESIDHIDLLYPDPWPKKRHWKRRFVNEKNLDRFARVLRPGGKFCFASDIDSYVNWTLQHILAHEAFDWCPDRPDDWRAPWQNWPSTRYEAKAFREGRTAAYLTFLKN